MLLTSITMLPRRDDGNGAMRLQREHAVEALSDLFCLLPSWPAPVRPTLHGRSVIDERDGAEDVGGETLLSVLLA